MIVSKSYTQALCHVQRRDVLPRGLGELRGVPARLHPRLRQQRPPLQAGDGAQLADGLRQPRHRLRRQGRDAPPARDHAARHAEHQEQGPLPPPLIPQPISGIYTHTLT